MSMKFRTEITITPSVSKIDQNCRLFSLGSCFAYEMAEKLEHIGITTLCNPLGELYNPLSIEQCVARLLEGRTVAREELHRRGDMWFSYHTHGSFDTTDSDALLESIGKAVKEGGEALARADVVILTLGSAWVYEREGEVVANCHKMPAGEFVRRRLGVEEVVASLERVVDMLSPRKVIFTLSPVRHLADGLEGNALSKATLRVALGEVCERRKEAFYFPAYEILVDDLRDYRYYADDMTHPSRVAVDYVWERFCDCFMEEKTIRCGEAFSRLAEAAAHRPLHPESEEYCRFRKTMLERAEALCREFPDNPVAARWVECFAPEK